MPVLELLELNFAELRGRMSGLSAVHTRDLWRSVYRDLVSDPRLRETIQAPLRAWLSERTTTISMPEVARETASSDGLTRKYLLRSQDGETVETVLMGYPGRFTACLSTQVGCAMGCVFCATGQSGFTRHLGAGEIVAQVLHVQRVLRSRGERGLRNLVLMGMGEPLHNYDAVMRALEIVTDPRGLNLGPSRISISTVGVVPGILRLAEERRPYNLAVSLHGATSAERGALVPVNRRWPLEELIEACRTYTRALGRKIFFEWTLIAGQNDTRTHAERLGALLEGIPSHVNLIPLNPTAGFEGAASGEPAAVLFQHTLRQAGIPSTIRQRRGIDVNAGCGQLRKQSETGGHRAVGALEAMLHPGGSDGALPSMACD